MSTTRDTGGEPWWAGPLALLACIVTAAMAATTLSVTFWPPDVLVAVPYLFMVVGLGLFVGGQVGRATYLVIGHAW